MENETMPADESAGIKKRMTTTAIITLMVVVLVVGGLIYYITNGNFQTLSFPDVGPEVEEEAEEVDTSLVGSMGLRLKGTQETFRVGDEVTLFIYATADDVELTAYDARIMYNNTQLEYVSMRSLLDGMDSWGNEIGEDDDSDENPETQELLVTGSQGTDRNDPYTFKDTALAEVTFEILDASEDMDVSFIFEPHDTTDSNLTNTSLEDVLGQTQGITLSVGQ